MDRRVEPLKVPKNNFEEKLKTFPDRKLRLKDVKIEQMKKRSLSKLSTRPTKHKVCKCAFNF